MRLEAENFSVVDIMQIVHIDEAAFREVVEAVDADAVATIEAPRELILPQLHKGVAIEAIGERAHSIEPPFGLQPEMGRGDGNALAAVVVVGELKVVLPLAVHDA